MEICCGLGWMEICDRNLRGKGTHTEMCFDFACRHLLS